MGKDLMLLIDVNNMLFRSLVVYGSYSPSVFYSFAQQFFSMVNAHRPDVIIACQDSPPYKRKEKYPAYKERKAERDEEVVRLIRAGRKQSSEFLGLLNIPVWSSEGLEADDMIAVACKKYHRLYDIRIASNDDDLYQLFRYENVSMIKKKGLYGVEEFCKDYPGLTPQDWVRYLSMVGTHNGLKGINGVGPKNAMKILSTEGAWQDTYDKHKDQLDFYAGLIELPLYHVNIRMDKYSCDYMETVNFLKANGVVTIKTYMEEALQFLSQ